MVWNADADAKVINSPSLAQSHCLTMVQLFQGVLAQFKPLRSKLDYEALAAYMGPGMSSTVDSVPGLLQELTGIGCTPCAIENRLVRLRRQVESVSFDSSTPKATPSSTPRKRKPVATPSTPGKKAKGKAKQTVPEEDDSETEMEEEPMKIEIKDEDVFDRIKEEHEEA